MGGLQEDAAGWLLFAGKLGVGVGALVLGLLYTFQNKILYHPNPPGVPKTPDEMPDGYKHPGQYTVSGSYGGRAPRDARIKYEEALVKTRDGESIHTWLLLQDDSANVPTLIYFHGNACNMGVRLPKAAHFFARIGANILMMDYRGYGASTGVPTEEGLNLDAQAVLDYAAAHPRLANSKLVLFGDSLGGAVAFSLAKRAPDKVHSIVVENTFSSISAMVDILFPYVGALKALVLRIGWDSLSIAPTLRQPMLFISGDRDSLVPPPHMRALYDAAVLSSSRDFFSVQGGDHNDSFEVAGAARFCARVRAFLAGAGGFGEGAAATAAAAAAASAATAAGAGAGAGADDRAGLTTAEILPNVY